jgi:ribosomal protein S19
MDVNLSSRKCTSGNLHIAIKLKRCVQSEKVLTLHKIYIRIYFKKIKNFFFIKKKNIVILPEFVGLIVKVYNGQKFFDITVLPSMVGHKFGEFVFTRKLHVFKTKR